MTKVHSTDLHPQVQIQSNILTIVGVIPTRNLQLFYDLVSASQDRIYKRKLQLNNTNGYWEIDLVHLNNPDL